MGGCGSVHTLSLLLPSQLQCLKHVLHSFMALSPTYSHSSLPWLQLLLGIPPTSFLTLLSQRCCHHHWRAQPWPVVGSYWAGCHWIHQTQAKLLALLTEATPTANPSTNPAMQTQCKTLWRTLWNWRPMATWTIFLLIRKTAHSRRQKSENLSEFGLPAAALTQLITAYHRLLNPALNPFRFFQILSKYLHCSNFIWLSGPKLSFPQKICSLRFKFLSTLSSSCLVFWLVFNQKEVWCINMFISFLLFF